MVVKGITQVSTHSG